MKRIALGIAAGLVVSAIVVALGGLMRGPRHPHTRLVAEDPSAPLSRIAIHYAPAADAVALEIYRQLFAVLPASVDVYVEVSRSEDFARFQRELAGTPHPDRFHAVVVGKPITTWSRDRYASLVDDTGHGTILAPPRIEAAFASRAGDAESPFAVSRALYHAQPRTANIVFEGGDLAATPHWVFADVNLAARNLGRANAAPQAIRDELRRELAQDIVWLGDAVGDVPRHHIMMYMVPLDDHTVMVGDVHAGLALLDQVPEAQRPKLDDVAVQAARFDRAAALLAGPGFRVLRMPVLVLDGGGAFVTYTNALFDRHGDRRVVYLPTYSLPALDRAATEIYEREGFEVHPIDVTPIYQLDGSLGCLVNVLARSAN